MALSWKHAVGVLAGLAGMLALSGAGQPAAAQSAQRQPNIVLVITDDQGFGDIGANANPALDTPHLDRLQSQSVRLDNFHVDPTCSPTRAALLSGQHSLRAGVWHTIMGRSLMPATKVTLAERLRAAGYVTGMFGKWHLGDNYPFRPQDQGFDRVVQHQGGGVGQTPDYWGNTQKDDMYFVDGEPRRFAGWSTDVWFDEATRFIADNRDRPFFAYIATNAPHAPYRAPQADIEPYLKRGLPLAMAQFYAMITGIDRRVGALRAELERLGIARETILIFMTDNGTSMVDRDAPDRPALAGWTFNAGMRGFKNDVYEGGHRVPFYLHWPAGEIGRPRDVRALAAHFDVMPTLLDLAGIPFGDGDFDGVSLAPHLRGGAPAPSRTLVVTNQRVDIPSLARPHAVMTDRWRLVRPGGDRPDELYDIIADPGQTRDLAAREPAVVAQLTGELEAWWNRTAPTDPQAQRERIIIGDARENPSRLTAMDWMEAEGERDVPWFPGFQRPGDARFAPSWLGRETQFKPLPWYLQVAETGTYRIAAYVHDQPAAMPINRRFAIFELDGKRHVRPVTGLSHWAEIDVPLAAGPMSMKVWFANDEAGTDAVLPAFFAYAERQGL